MSKNAFPQEAKKAAWPHKSSDAGDYEVWSLDPFTCYLVEKATRRQLPGYYDYTAGARQRALTMTREKQQAFADWGLKGEPS